MSKMIYYQSIFIKYYYLYVFKIYLYVYIYVNFIYVLFLLFLIISSLFYLVNKFYYFFWKKKVIKIFVIILNRIITKQIFLKYISNFIFWIIFYLVNFVQILFQFDNKIFIIIKLFINVNKYYYF